VPAAFIKFKLIDKIISMDVKRCDIAELEGIYSFYIEHIPKDTEEYIVFQKDLFEYYLKNETTHFLQFTLENTTIGYLSMTKFHNVWVMSHYIIHTAFRRKNLTSHVIPCCMRYFNSTELPIVFVSLKKLGIAQRYASKQIRVIQGPRELKPKETIELNTCSAELYTMIKELLIKKYQKDLHTIPDSRYFEKFMRVYRYRDIYIIYYWITLYSTEQNCHFHYIYIWDIVCSRRGNDKTNKLCAKGIEELNKELQVGIFFSKSKELKGLRSIDCKPSIITNDFYKINIPDFKSHTLTSIFFL
jgi:hypothetical protein